MPYATPRTATLSEFLWGRATKGDGCWEWKNKPNPDGYVTFSRKIDGQRRYFSAHRLAWELTYGPIPGDKIVLHGCDNRKCLRPDHLRLGTQLQNMEDMRAKNRQPKGEAKYNAKLTAAKVREIRERYAKGGIGVRRLSREYGVGERTLWSAIKRINWKYVE